MKKDLPPDLPPIMFPLTKKRMMERMKSPVQGDISPPVNNVRIMDGGVDDVLPLPAFICVIKSRS